MDTVRLNIVGNIGRRTVARLDILKQEIDSFEYEIEQEEKALAEVEERIKAFNTSGAAAPDLDTQRAFIDRKYHREVIRLLHAAVRRKKRERDDLLSVNEDEGFAAGKLHGFSSHFYRAAQDMLDRTTLIEIRKEAEERKYIEAEALRKELGK